MTITIPSGQPNNRFMRYVRPPVKDIEKLPPLFPLQPATRPLRLGIDTTTVPGGAQRHAGGSITLAATPHRGEDDWYRIEATEVQTLRDLFTVTLDLLDKEWFGGTDWRAFCRRTLSMSPR
jgi:hypothetical protein